MTDINSDVLHR